MALHFKTSHSVLMLLDGGAAIAANFTQFLICSQYPLLIGLARRARDAHVTFTFSPFLLLHNLSPLTTDKNVR